MFPDKSNTKITFLSSSMENYYSKLCVLIGRVALKGQNPHNFSFHLKYDKIYSADFFWVSRFFIGRGVLPMKTTVKSRQRRLRQASSPTLFLMPRFSSGPGRLIPGIALLLWFGCSADYKTTPKSSF